MIALCVFCGEWFHPHYPWPSSGTHAGACDAVLCRIEVQAPRMGEKAEIASTALRLAAWDMANPELTSEWRLS